VFVVEGQKVLGELRLVPDDEASAILRTTKKEIEDKAALCNRS
jgi:hypothetical protein